MISEESRERAAVALTSLLVGVMFVACFLLIAFACFPSFVTSTVREGPRESFRAFRLACVLVGDSVVSAMRAVGIVFKGKFDARRALEERKKYWIERAGRRLSEKEVLMLDQMEKMS